MAEGGTKKKKKKQAKEDLAALTDMSRARDEAVGSARRQIRTAAKVAIIAVVVIWLVCLAMWSGLKSTVPLMVAGSLTLGLGIAALLIRRNLAKSEELGALLMQGSDLDPEERDRRLAKLEARVEKGDAGAIIAKAQLQMQDTPREALETLEKVNLEKAQKAIANQVRGMRAMIHLNLGEVKAARKLADDVLLDKTPDLKSRATVAGIVAEAWARSGNPIESGELLDKYDPDDKQFEDVRVQLYRARAFACAHQNNMNGMRKSLKQLSEISPQLLAVFVGPKAIHPLLQKEARQRLEKSGLIPKQKIQVVRR